MTPQALARQTTRYRSVRLSRAKDKFAAWTRSRATTIYTCPVGRTLRGLDAFTDWVNRAHAYLKEERGWGYQRVAQEAQVARSLLSNWRKGDYSQGQPQRDTVLRMCTNLGLDLDEPFAIFGWDPTAVPVDPKPIATPTMAERYRELLEMRYDTPDLTPDDEIFLDDQIEAVLEMIKRRRKRRGEGPSQSRTAS